MYRIPVIFDVDTGLDDALMLAMACALPELDILAVTATFGNSGLKNTLRNTLNVLKLCGREDIPVGTGADRPMIQDPDSYTTDSAFIHGEDGMGGIQFPFPDTTAAISPLPAHDLMYQCLCQSEEPVVIVCVGPHTNAALLLQKYPECKSKIRCFVNMGGIVRGGLPAPMASINIYHDPHSVDLLMTSGIPFYMCGGDFTGHALVTREEMAELEKFRSPTGKVLCQMLKAYYGTCSSVGESEVDGLVGQSLHDPCSLAFLVHPEYFSYGRYWGRVETRSDFCAAMTVIDYEDTLKKPKEEKFIYMMDGIQRAAFARFFLDTLGCYEEGGAAQ